MKVSKKYHKIAEAYQYFCGNMDADFSEQAKLDMFCYESFGKPVVKYDIPQSNGQYNGYAVGKHWMDVTIAMWIEDLNNGSRVISKHELLNDPEIPDFIKTIIRKI